MDINNDKESVSAITMCNTPKIMTLDICKSCQRYTEEDVEGAEIFKVKKTSFGWQCEEHLHTAQGNLFEQK